MNIRHHFSDGMYAKEIFIPQGTMVPQHAHKYAHFSMLASGEVDIEVDGVTSEFVGPVLLNIQANRVHMVKAKTDAVWYCIHATDETDPDTIDDAVAHEWSIKKHGWSK